MTGRNLFAQALEVTGLRNTIQRIVPRDEQAVRRPHSVSPPPKAAEPAQHTPDVVMEDVEEKAETITPQNRVRRRFSVVMQERKITPQHRVRRVNVGEPGHTVVKVREIEQIGRRKGNPVTGRFGERSQVHHRWEFETEEEPQPQTHNDTLFSLPKINTGRYGHGR